MSSTAACAVQACDRHRSNRWAPPGRRIRRSFPASVPHADSQTAKEANANGADYDLF